MGTILLVLWISVTVYKGPPCFSGDEFLVDRPSVYVPYILLVVVIINDHDDSKFSILTWWSITYSVAEGFSVINARL